MLASVKFLLPQYPISLADELVQDIVQILKTHEPEIHDPRIIPHQTLHEILVLFWWDSNRSETARPLRPDSGPDLMKENNGAA